MRPSRRAPDELRPISIERSVARYAEGSCLIKFGETHVLCTAKPRQDKPPSWLRGTGGKGWGDGGIFGCCRVPPTSARASRSSSGKPSGLTQEIQRLVGRSLRAIVDLVRLGEKQIVIDCDVLQADGGTRTASITGGWIALPNDCCRWMIERKMLAVSPIKDHVAADFLRHLQGRGRARPRLCRGFRGPDRCQFRHDRRWRPSRNPGHRRGRTFQRRAIHHHAGARKEGHRRIGGVAEEGERLMGRLLAGKLVLATHNNGKLAEFQALMAPYGVDVLSVGQLGLPVPEETGTTFIENARIKALAALQATGLPALADDSGLCIEALGGAPGVYTADWAGPTRSWDVAMKPRRRMNCSLPVPQRRRSGARHIHLGAGVWIWPDCHSETFEGRAEGILVWPTRGTHGHGYDPMFQPDGSDLTFAEMPEMVKNTVSHRARSFETAGDSVFEEVADLKKPGCRLSQSCPPSAVRCWPPGSREGRPTAARIVSICICRSRATISRAGGSPLSAGISPLGERQNASTGTAAPQPAGAAPAAGA